MQTLADSRRGIPIPIEEIRSALESVAIPGFTGVLQLDLGLDESAAKAVMITVVRRQTQKIVPAEAGTQVTRQVLPDPSRKKPVQGVIDAIKSVLMIRTVLSGLEVHYVDGVVQKITKQE